MDWNAKARDFEKEPITTGEIADGAVTNSKVASLDAGKLTSGTVPDARLSGQYTGVTLKLNKAAGEVIYATPSAGSGTTEARIVEGLASYASKASSVTGAIVFAASAMHTSGIMHQIEVSIHRYTREHMQLTVTGYHNENNTPSTWGYAFATSTGAEIPLVRWGVTPQGYACLILGDVGTVWTYPHVAITRAMISYSGVSDAYCKGWTAALVTDLSAYTVLTPCTMRPLATNITGSAAITNPWTWAQNTEVSLGGGVYGCRTVGTVQLTADSISVITLGGAASGTAAVLGYGGFVTFPGSSNQVAVGSFFYDGSASQHHSWLYRIDGTGGTRLMLRSTGSGAAPLDVWIIYTK
ncbi:hypothetical protein [Nitratidesulfovibrio termitidis]|uniref:hypothetical protein n=1 Tax=Nitratidesulfovibrio termitidis TaxID=42252 RepID=UPI00041DC685|nr:hypothetical protein [Nitratidesulfovibrio termitidis]